MSIWLPPTVNRHLQDETSAYRAEAMAALVLSEELREYNRELKEIDPDLMVGWFGEDVDLLGVKPGRFHLIRDNGAMPPALIPYEDEDGGFLPLGSHLFDLVRRSDLWNDQVTRDRRHREEAAERARERAKQREREEIALEIDERFKAKESPGVSFANQGKGWSYRANARKAA